MVRKFIEQTNFEIGQIDCLFESYSELLERMRQKEPDLVEMTALASVLHSFYTGLEKIFHIIAREIDGDIPTGSRWHRDLLVRMSEPTPIRGAVLGSAVSEQLDSYLVFRHFYRHAYSFFLDWNELEKLVIPISEVWKETKSELHRFAEQFESESGGKQ